MAKQRYGKDTRIKLIAGELTIKMPSKEIERIDQQGQRIKTTAENLSPLLHEYAYYMLDRIEERFKKQGLPRRWRPLSPAYKKAKVRAGYGNKGILERTGQLRRGFRAKVTPRTVQIYNRRKVGNVNLFDVHQHGTRDRRIPARPMLVYGKAEKTKLQKLFEEYFEADD